MGKILYKYYSSDRIELFDKFQLCFRCPFEQNDPFEVCPTTNDILHEGYLESEHEGSMLGLYDSYKKVSGLNPSYNEFCMKYKKITDIEFDNLREKKLEKVAMTPELVKETMKHKYHMFCLSEDWDNILMWSHYTKNHEGFVVGFDVDESNFFKTNKPGDISIRKVKYQKHRIDLGSLNREKLDAVDLFFTKSPDWNYEKEWRTLFYGTPDKKEIEEGDRFLYLYEIPPSIIKEVYFGLNMLGKHKIEILEKVKKNKKLRHLNVYQTERSLFEFKLEKARIQFMNQGSKSKNRKHTK